MPDFEAKDSWLWVTPGQPVIVRLREVKPVAELEPEPPPVVAPQVAVRLPEVQPATELQPEPLPVAPPQVTVRLPEVKPVPMALRATKGDENAVAHGSSLAVARDKAGAISHMAAPLLAEVFNRGPELQPEPLPVAPPQVTVRLPEVKPGPMALRATKGDENAVAHGSSLAVARDKAGAISHMAAPLLAVVFDSGPELQPESLPVAAPQVTLPMAVPREIARSEVPPADSEWERGRTLFDAGDYGPALECFQGIAARSPAQRHLVFNIAVCLERLERFDEAEQALREATELDGGPARPE